MQSCCKRSKRFPLKVEGSSRKDESSTLPHSNEKVKTPMQSLVCKKWSWRWWSASWVALTRTSHCCATQNQEAVSLCQGDVHPYTASIVSDSARLICSVQTMVKIPNGKRWHILQTYQNHITFLVAEAWETDCVLTDVNPLKALGMGLRVKTVQHQY